MASLGWFEAPDATAMYGLHGFHTRQPIQVLGAVVVVVQCATLFAHFTVSWTVIAANTENKQQHHKLYIQIL